jgi:hypothetical protein
MGDPVSASAHGITLGHPGIEDTAAVMFTTTTVGRSLTSVHQVLTK